jgi:pantoate--beta-alanine ligase
MIVFVAVDEFYKWRKELQAQGHKTIGFVPTMGAFHDGHRSLIEKCREENDIVVVSIYVNKLQFNDAKDYENYPSTPNIRRQDLEVCESLGVDVVLTPEKNGMYRDAHSTYVDVEGLTNHLCGETRPGHFRGVCTIVAKLFNLVRPDVAYLGQKDFQQLTIIKKMVEDLHFPIHIQGLPTVRESSGLAMSSRNKLLSSKAKIEAMAIYRGLTLAHRQYQEGERVAQRLMDTVQRNIEGSEYQSIDYLEVVSQKTLQPLKKVTEPALIAVSVFYENVKLLDNVCLDSLDSLNR